MAFQPTLRLVKGEELTYQEMDDNFQGLADSIQEDGVAFFNSFELMVAADLTRRSLVATRGYYVDGNGKGAGIYIKTSITGIAGETNGGSYFHDSEGNKWVLQHNGTVSIDQFGFVADYNADLDTGTDNTAKIVAIAADSSISKVIGAKGNYYFGTLVNNSGAKASFDRSIDLDWQGAHIFIKLIDENAANINGVFVQFTESYSAMRNFEFTHIGWDRTKAGIGNRGIFPVVISSFTTSTKDIHGFEFENVLVHRGQGLFAASSSKIANGYNYNASGIEIKGFCHGEEVYYGISLFHSGNNTKGRYTLTNFNRAYISYDVSDVDLEIVATGDNQATSASLIPYTTGDRPSKNIKIKARFAMINGPVSPTAEHEAGDTAIMDNWDIDVYIDTLGDNMTGVNAIPFRVGAVSVTTGIYQETGTYNIRQNCRFKVRTGRSIVVNNYFLLYTPSPNIKPFYVDARNLDLRTPKMQQQLFYTPNGLQIGHTGDIQTTPLTFSLRDALDKNTSPAGLFANGTAVFTTTGTTANKVLKKFWFVGSLTSGGLEIAEHYDEYESFVAGTYNPTITVTTDPFGSEFVTIQATAGGDVNGNHVFTFNNTAGGSINL